MRRAFKAFTAKLTGGAGDDTTNLLVAVIVLTGLLLAAFELVACWWDWGWQVLCPYACP